MSDERPESMIWRRSSRCADNACVEVAQLADRVLVRGGPRPGGQELSFPSPSWVSFVVAVRTDRLAAQHRFEDRRR
jgi:hypothetical protein